MKIVCSHCGHTLTANDTICPNCKSSDREIYEEESLLAMEGDPSSVPDEERRYIYKLWKRMFPGTKPFEEIYEKRTFDRDTQQEAIVYRKVDRENDSYDEIFYNEEKKPFKKYIKILHRHRNKKRKDEDGK